MATQTATDETNERIWRLIQEDPKQLLFNLGDSSVETLLNITIDRLLQLPGESYRKAAEHCQAALLALRK